jgi:hypothetical protein
VTRRAIEALENLAERPGTEHEGEVAREMLRKARERGITSEADEEDRYISMFRTYLRGEMTFEDFLGRTRAAYGGYKNEAPVFVPANRGRFTKA